MEQRKEIDGQIDVLLQKVSTYADRYISRWNDVEELKIQPESSAIGCSLRELKVREETGATVVGVVRNGNENFSPEADFLLEEGDILLVVSSENGNKKVRSLLK